MDRVKTSFIAALIILVAGGSFSLALRHPPETSPAGVRLASIPSVKNGWIGRDISIGPAVEEALDVNQYVYREYVNGSGLSVWLFVGYFTSQKFGSGIHSPRNCLPGSGWEIVNRSYSPLPGDSSLSVNRMNILRGESRQVMYYWFVTRAGHLNNEYSLKGSLIKSALLGDPTDAAFIRINTAMSAFSPTDAEKGVEEFVRIFEKEIYSALPF